MKITIETVANSTLDKVWHTWNNPDDIKQWNAASDDWHTTASTVDLREGGVFSSRMEAKDGSMGFDFAGTYTKVIPMELIEFTMGDERTVSVRFSNENGKVKVIETFDADKEYDVEFQRQGWQSILDSFARHVESKS